MKKKILPIILASACLLAGCSNGDGDKIYDKEGFTSKVTFNFNGGTLTNSVTDIKDYIIYGFQPDTYICDPANLPKYSLFKNGYNFAGWYKDQDFNTKWDFANDKIYDESITLYAKWDLKISYTYTLAYTNASNEEIDIYSYEVNGDKKFSDFLGKASSVDGYTALGFYQDKDLTIPWDESYEHPGGEESLDIKVYVKYIEGVYTVVRTYNDLISARGSIYLMNDIDCENKPFKISNDFNYEFKGNGYKVSSFVVNAPTSGTRLYYSIFSNLTDGAKIEDVTFDNVTINSPSKAINTLGIGGLSGKASGNVKVSNVQITNAKVVMQDGLTFTNAEGDKVDTSNMIALEGDGLVLEVTNYSANYQLIDNRKGE